ncbi:MAG: deoxyribose-phosphate aldolase [Candidatus Dormibacteraceae bacterium]
MAAASAALRSFASKIDHTLLRPDATPGEIEHVCSEAILWGFATVCVNSAFTKLAAEQVRGTPVGVSTTVAFPFGASNTSAKLREAAQAVADGATELDVVIEIGWLKAKRDDLVAAEIKAIRAETRGHTLKVIIETGLLTNEEKARGARLAVEAGAEYVKTSTGYAKLGDQLSDVALLRRILAPDIRIKVSGGIRTFAGARALLDAGADRLGSSHGVQLIEDMAAGLRMARPN